jgi:2'-hydroxyisoflavone reductase
MRTKSIPLLMIARRDFLKTTGAAAGALMAGSACGVARAAVTPERPGPHSKPLDILVLGGTGFIGPHLVSYAVSRGHRITIFTRGRHTADLPESVIHLEGDRNGGLDALRGKRWDAVVDDSATNPKWVQDSAELLRDNVGRYLFTSSTGVYYPYLRRGIDESGPVPLTAADPKDGSATFGVAKALCEQQTQRVFGERAVIVRPSYIVGPGDTTDRFPYWPVRLARGGEVLAPGRKDDPAQFIDVRDLAEFMVHLLEGSRSGAYNVAGPRTAGTARAFLEVARATINPSVQYTFVDDYDFLAAHKIDEAIPWAMLKGNDYGMMSVKSDKAIAAGLSFRPVEQTLRDTLAWWPSVPDARREKPKFAISAERERAALKDWHART